MLYKEVEIISDFIEEDDKNMRKEILLKERERLTEKREIRKFENCEIWTDKIQFSQSEKHSSKLGDMKGIDWKNTKSKENWL